MRVDRPRERPEAGDIMETYRTHPLRAASIVARARGEGRVRPFRERDLAFDRRTRLTDQNHVGGALAVLALADAAGVRPRSRVLDLGSGLGGPGRLLAERYGCHVLGVDLSAARHRDAVRLTRLVGLDDRVRFRRGDIRDFRPDVGRFDVVWGQGSWIHVADPRSHLVRAAAVLRPRGRVAFEEAALVRPPRGPAERRRLRELCRLWGAMLSPPRSWLDACERAGLRVARADDLTAAMHADLRGRDATSPPGTVRSSAESASSDRERRAVHLARTLVEDGVLGHLRVIAERPGSP